MKKPRPHWHQKALGQNFLVDRGVCAAIVDAFVDSVGTSDVRWVEIGPGRGALTELLLTHATPSRPLTVVEKDRGLAAEWRARAEGGAPLTVIEADFLELPEDFFAEPFVVIGNLPYSVGTAILTRLSQRPEQVKAMVLMLQAEVAERIRAVPGTKAWGSLSLWVQNLWSVEKILRVSPKAFRPAPKIWSEVIRLTPRAEPLIAETARAPERWETLLRTAFQHRRKMLRSALPTQGPWKAALAQSGLDETRRAESLGWDEWGQLYAALIRS